MSIHIIIDGYNLIRQSGFLGGLESQSIQAGRDALVEMLAAYRRVKHHNITVVFDGSSASCDFPSRDRIQGVGIVFSRCGELADAVIKRMAAREKEKAIVVSSDQDIIRHSAASGCATLSSPVFEQKLMLASRMNSGDPDSDADGGWIPTTRKKGPSSRLSKRMRQNRIRTDKL
jgi:predicted RNA-binding protein with PIN domain